MVLDAFARQIRRRGPNPNLRPRNSLDYWANWTARDVTSQVGDEEALAVTAFYRGVQLIASTIASLPLHVYRQKSDGTREQLSTPDTAYLRVKPNVEMGRQTLWEHVIADEVRGNGFIWVDKDDNGSPIGIWYVDRRRIQVGRTSSGRKIYVIDGDEALIDYNEGGEIVHFPNWGRGLVGYDPITIGRAALKLGLSAQEYAERYFSDDGIPPGYLSTDQELTPEESDRAEQRWMKRRSGRNKRMIAVLSRNVTFHTTQAKPDEAQMQDVRSFQGEEVARLLGIPPHMLGFTEKVTSWGSGIEEQTTGFVVFTLGAHIHRFEQGVSDNLLVRELTDRYAKWDTGGLLRGTSMQRAQFYALAWGRWMVPNEIRRLEDLPPIPGGDEMPVGANLIPLDKLGEDAPNPQSSGGIGTGRGDSSPQVRPRNP